MTIADLRELVDLPSDASDAEVVFAYAALIEDGLPASIEIEEPVTVEQARLHCKIEVTAENALIEQKIRTAREWVEDYTGRIVAQRVLVTQFRGWGAFLELPGRPIGSIVAVAYNGAAGPALVSGSIFARGVYPARIYPGAAAWPSLGAAGGVAVAYQAGYAPGEAPHCVIEAILVLVFGMMADRDGAYDQSIRAAERLLERLTTARV